MKYTRLGLAVAAGIVAASSLQAGLIFTIENAGVQQTTVALASTEDFESVPLGEITTYVSSAVGGTYSGGEVINANQYGGAGNTGKYDVVGLGTTTSQTLTFDSGKTYFGLWWSAGDAANTLKFYDENGGELGSYVIGSIIPYLSDAYRGNPVTKENMGEYYAYLNFTTTGGSLIKSIEFGNLTSSGFESDNHSVYDKVITPPGHAIPDGGSSVAMLGGALAVLGLVRRKQA